MERAAIRSVNDLPTVFTSNLSLDELAQVYAANDNHAGGRMVSRLREMAAVIPVGGEDLRSMGKP